MLTNERTGDRHRSGVFPVMILTMMVLLSATIVGMAERRAGRAEQALAQQAHSLARLEDMVARLESQQTALLVSTFKLPPRPELAPAPVQNAAAANPMVATTAPVDPAKSAELSRENEARFATARELVERATHQGRWSESERQQMRELTVSLTQDQVDALNLSLASAVNSSRLVVERGGGFF